MESNISRSTRMFRMLSIQNKGIFEGSNIICEFLENFESQIRQDQDKITRHACAENINDLEHDCETPNGDDAIRTDTAYETVMNTKAL